MRNFVQGDMDLFGFFYMEPSSLASTISLKMCFLPCILFDFFKNQISVHMWNWGFHIWQKFSHQILGETVSQLDMVYNKAKLPVPEMGNILLKFVHGNSTAKNHRLLLSLLVVLHNLMVRAWLVPDSKLYDYSLAFMVLEGILHALEEKLSVITQLPTTAFCLQDRLVQ